MILSFGTYSSFSGVVVVLDIMLVVIGSSLSWSSVVLVCSVYHSLDLLYFNLIF